VEDTTMMLTGIFFAIAAIGALCWLLFTLSVFALPVFAGASAGIWASQTGGGWIGGIAVALAVAGSLLGASQLLLAHARRLWLRIAVGLAFIAPAGFAGFHATHGVVKHLVPSETWQLAFSVIGAAAVGFVAFLRLGAVAAPGPAGGGIAQV
jgi:hypothetical protein